MTEVELKPITSLKPFHYNPKNRVLDVSDLITTMTQSGYWEWCPVIVTADGTIVDGNRRYTAAKELGLKEIPAIVLPATTDKNKVWAELNLNRRAITSREYAEAYDHGLKYLTETDHRGTKDIKDVLALGGDKLLHDLVEAKISPSAITQARTLLDYCGIKRTNDELAKALRWLVKYRAQRAIRWAVRYGVSPTKVYRAYKENRELRLKTEAM